MKKSITLLLAILTTISIFSQAPEKMSYQAVIRNSSNELVVSNTVGMRISILQGSAEGTVVYTETQTPSTNANGLVSIEIGGGEGFSSIDWSSGTYFIKTETDPLGGSSYTIMGTSQLLSVPYSLHAKTAEYISGTINYDETDPVFSSSEAANVTSNDITKLSKLSGANSGDQDLSDYATKSALGDSTALVRSEIPDIRGLLRSETDPLYTSSPSADITELDIINLGNLSGVNTGDQDLSNLVRMHQLIDSLTIIRSEIPDVSGFIAEENDPHFIASVANGINAADTANWNSKLSSPWIKNLENLFYNTGNVGIGNDSPQHKVDVVGDINITGDYKVNGVNIQTNGGLPTGGIIQFMGATAPDGYLICDGSEVSRTEYAELFAILGITYGTGDGVLTFNLPNFQGRIPVGRNSSDIDFNDIGVTGGAKTHTLSTEEIPMHMHTLYPLSIPTSESGDHTHTFQGGTITKMTYSPVFNHYNYHYDASITNITQSSGIHSHIIDIPATQTSNVGSGNPHNNLQPYIVVNYIIKH